MKLNAKARFLRTLQPLLAATAVLLACPSADAAWYAKFDGIEGSSKDRDHGKWIEILSFDSGTHKPGGGTASPSAPDLRAFRLEAALDKATPKLLEAAVKGKVIPKVEIHLTGEDGEASAEPYFIIELTNVSITSFQTGGRADTVPTEELTLNYEKARWTYNDSDGSKGGNVEFEWKVEEGES